MAHVRAPFLQISVLLFKMQKARFENTRIPLVFVCWGDHHNFHGYKSSPGENQCGDKLRFHVRVRFRSKSDPLIESPGSITLDGNVKRNFLREKFQELIPKLGVVEVAYFLGDCTSTSQPSVVQHLALTQYHPAGILFNFVSDTTERIEMFIIYTQSPPNSKCITRSDCRIETLDSVC